MKSELADKNILSSEKISFTGKFSEVVVNIAHFDDGYWRWDVSIDVHDTFSVSGGLRTPIKYGEPFVSRTKCLKDASHFIREYATKNYRFNNPKSVDEIDKWLKTVGEPECEQMLLFR